MADLLKSRWYDFFRRLSSMLNISVALLNGNPVPLRLSTSSTVQDVRTKAQRAFGKKYLKLVTAKNRVLVDFEQTLEEAGIEDGECLTALAFQPQLAATSRALALRCHGDGSIVTWGRADYGGDSSAVQNQLRGVQQIQATERAFAAILADGPVVAWGRSDFGGDNSAVQDQLRGVNQIQATERAFAAILEDGSVVTWGSADFGGDRSAVQDKLRGVKQIQATSGAFAAILEDGSVVTWGSAGFGGDSSAVQDQLRGVNQIQATYGAFAAILEDGSAVTWGSSDFGGDSRAVLDQLNKLGGLFVVGKGCRPRAALRSVRQIQASCRAFAAVLEDGSIVTWGDHLGGGDSSAVQNQLKDVQQVHAARDGAFAAILADGSVVTWGLASYGGDSSAVRDQPKGV